MHFGGGTGDFEANGAGDADFGGSGDADFGGNGDDLGAGDIDFFGGGFGDGSFLSVFAVIDSSVLLFVGSPLFSFALSVLFEAWSFSDGISKVLLAASAARGLEASAAGGCLADSEPPGLLAAVDSLLGIGVAAVAFTLGTTPFCLEPKN